MRGSRLILASASPQRKKLMEHAGYEFEVRVSPLDEPNHIARHMSPQSHSEALAWFKCVAVAKDAPDATILAADTIVAACGEIIGKPADADDARRILNMLCRNRHAVITSLALISPARERILVSVITWVTMRLLGEHEIEAYIASGEWQGKAGAYGIQGAADAFVEKIEGSYTNVIGLPMETVKELIPQD